MIPRKWIYYTVAVFIFVILWDEFAYTRRKNLNPGWQWTNVKTMPMTVSWRVPQYGMYPNGYRSGGGVNVAG